MSSREGSSAKAILYAFSANLGIAITKTAAAVYTNSGSMLAEAIHSYADCFNQVLLYVGLRRAVRPATADHPLGYGKASYFWSFIVALMLFSMGGLFSVYEGWHKLQAPQELNKIWIGLIVLGVAILLESSSLYGSLAEIRKLRNGRAFGEWFKNTRNAELVVVLGEDVAALIGLVLAFGFLSLAWYTGDARYDAIGSISIGLVLIAVAMFVGARIASLLLGKSAEPLFENRIRELINADPQIEQLLNAITLRFGPKVMVAAKIRMRSDLSINEAVAHINALERRLKASLPEIGWCFIEPDVTD